MKIRAVKSMPLAGTRLPKMSSTSGEARMVACQVVATTHPGAKEALNESRA